MNTHILGTGVTGFGSKLGSGTDGVSTLVTLPFIINPQWIKGEEIPTPRTAGQ